MTKEELIEDLKVMIEADRQHMKEAEKRGDRVIAASFRHGIIATQQELQKLTES